MKRICLTAILLCIIQTTFAQSRFHYWECSYPTNPNIGGTDWIRGDVSTRISKVIITTAADVVIWDVTKYVTVKAL